MFQAVDADLDDDNTAGENADSIAAFKGAAIVVRGKDISGNALNDKHSLMKVSKLLICVLSLVILILQLVQ